MAKSKDNKNSFPKATNMGRMVPKPSISTPSNTNEKPVTSTPKTDNKK